ncbi:unnamed protein product [Didymodactylos carnosus]|uniref:Major facilitator superfamily (MFS) profile domain-containing protein n=1 Tax=Didymodactylos carnosus TaxID=1234261 RepID=A0A815CY70_9BILA|nr:unnamed protein product [Didymodactylos carnosus]CAF1293421.1 unnamed protein product [Didymodactylos carnosus]CAF3750991.1 unnamed protein product [Didymodactylos carnosus]CAF4103303.1 unnamed protein product [Didymodactylos carnosus]
MIKSLSNIAGEEEEQKEIKNVDLSTSVVDEISIYNIHTKFQHNIILFWISVTVILSPFADTIFLPAIHTIALDLKTNDELVTLTVSVSLISNGISCLIWGVISDRYGRNITMRIGLALFIIFSIICGCAPNITVLIIFRVLQGATVSVTVIVGQGVIADIYPPGERGWATGIFFVPVLVGAVGGPAIGGPLTYFFGWRSTFILLAIISIFILVAHVLIIPETHQYKVLVKYSEKTIIESRDISEPRLVKPWLPLIYLTDLTILLYIVSATVPFAFMMTDQTLLTTLLAQKPYSFNEIQTGVSLLPLGLAAIIGCFLGGALSDKANHYYTNNIPEGRLVPGLIGLILVPFGLAMYGWSFYFRLNAILPILSATIVAFGQSIYRPGVSSYLTVTKQQHAATIVSVNTFLNHSIAGISILVAVLIYPTINIGMFFTILSGINIAAIIPACALTVTRIRSYNKNYQPI